MRLLTEGRILAALVVLVELEVRGATSATLRRLIAYLSQIFRLLLELGGAGAVEGVRALV